MRPYRTALAAAIALGLACTALADAPYVDSAMIKQVQQTLQARGFNAGRSDGVMGPRTELAVKNFQASENLEPSGQLNRQTLVALGLQGDEGVVMQPAERYSAATIRQVQETLNHRGFHAGRVDGVLGPDLRVALKNFQASENLEQSGELNRQTLAALGIDAEPLGVSRAPTQAAYLPSLREVQQALNDRGFLSGPADGIMGRRTELALRALQRAEHLAQTGRIDSHTLAALGFKPVPPVSAEVGVGERMDSIRNVQRALNARGFNAGPEDGVMGPRTVIALREFQRSERLATTGQLNRRTLDVLGLEAR